MADETIKLKKLDKEEVADEEEYDPHEHRTTAHPTTNLETLIHLLKSTLGTGILAMPEAFKHAGIIVGFLATMAIGYLCTYCLHILIKAQYKLCKRQKIPLLTYPESMEQALLVGPQCLKKFAGCSKICVDVFLIVYQVGICCVYIVFVAENIKQIVDYYSITMSIYIHLVILIIPFILINSVRNLKYLAPFSTVANIITFVGFGILIYYIAQYMGDVSKRTMAGTVYAFPLFMGTTLFALEAVGVMIALENNMKNPKDFVKPVGVLNVGMIIITLMYIAMGFAGYWRYGEGSRPSITLNLPKHEILANVVRITMAIAIFISYGLQCYVPVDTLWNVYLKKRVTKCFLLWEYVLRIAIVLVTFIFAIAIPRLGLFISFIGAVCLSALGIAFPAIMDICVRWPDDLGCCKWKLWKNILLIIFGIAGLLSGSYSSISEIVKSFQ